MFTLFNLQGTSGFSTDISTGFIVLPNSARNSFIITQPNPFVKNFFQILFCGFQCFAPLSKQLPHNTTYKTHCQLLFYLFFDIFCVSALFIMKRVSRNNTTASYTTPIPFCRKFSLNSARPGRFRFMTVQIPTPARPNSFTRSNFACQERTSSNQTSCRMPSFR